MSRRKRRVCGPEKAQGDVRCHPNILTAEKDSTAQDAVLHVLCIVLAQAQRKEQSCPQPGKGKGRQGRRRIHGHAKQRWETEQSARTSGRRRTVSSPLLSAPLLSTPFLHPPLRCRPALKFSGSKPSPYYRDGEARNDVSAQRRNCVAGNPLGPFFSREVDVRAWVRGRVGGNGAEQDQADEIGGASTGRRGGGGGWEGLFGAVGKRSGQGRILVMGGSGM